MSLLAVSNDVWIGLVVLALSLAANLLLVLWSRRRIERINRLPGRSAREIQRQLNGD